MQNFLFPFSTNVFNKCRPLNRTSKIPMYQTWMMRRSDRWSGMRACGVSSWLIATRGGRCGYISQALKTLSRHVLFKFRAQRFWSSKGTQAMKVYGNHCSPCLQQLPAYCKLGVGAIMADAQITHRRHTCTCRGQGMMSSGRIDWCLRREIGVEE